MVLCKTLVTILWSTEQLSLHSLTNARVRSAASTCTPFERHSLLAQFLYCSLTALVMSFPEKIDYPTRKPGRARRAAVRHNHTWMRILYHSNISFLACDRIPNHENLGSYNAHHVRVARG
jgi:hypothetical protein